MKKFYYLAAIFTAAISCQVDDMNNNGATSTEGTMEFNAIVAETRTVLNQMTPEWSKGETIYVFDEVGGKELFTAQNESQSASAKFKGNILSGESFIAVSPSSAVVNSTKANIDNKTISGLTIPYEQNAVVGSYDPKAMISVAYTEDNTLVFNNAVTLLKFTVNADNVNDVTFAGWNGENMTGETSVTITPEGAKVSSASKTYVKVKGSFQKGKTYYAVVAPGEYSKGLLCEFNGAKVQVTESAITLQPNTIVDLGSISYTGVYLRGGFNSWGQYQMCKAGDWYAAYGVQVMKTENDQDEGFKFEKGGTWYGGGSSKVLYTDHTIGSSNITIAGDSNLDSYKNASFDVFVSKDFKKYKIRIHQEREKRATTITVNKTNNWSKLYAYSWYYVGSTKKEPWGSWPGKDISSTKKVEIPKDCFGINFNYILNNNSGQQTPDTQVFVTGDFTYDLK